ncbi:MAG TPA: ribosome small subunit-dependent GTPase A, partial [Thiobacillaceae bacterium]|nr:ribosome small subunit-dependent GTPase A [Thiobacillaceae bacterium]
CVMRGKKGGIACGDRVAFQPIPSGGGVIEKVEARDNLLYRSDEMRSKLIAANLDLAVVVTAAVPYFREELLIRCLVSCETADIPVLILLNKTDLAETAALAKHLAAYGALGYDLLAVSAMGDLSALEARLRGRTSVLVGGSGMGKSTLLNRLVPDAHAATGEISESLDAGRHTTTHARMYRLPSGGQLIDSPGMQEFGLQHLDAAALMAAFPEIRERVGQCRFYNCRHLKEPGCAVREAAETGAMLPVRYKVYQSLLGQLAAAP